MKILKPEILIANITEILANSAKITIYSSANCTIHYTYAYDGSPDVDDLELIDKSYK